jgi:hypothetical protein
MPNARERTLLGLLSLSALACIEPVDKGRGDAGLSLDGPPAGDASMSMSPSPMAGGGSGNLGAGLISRWKLDEADGNTAADSAGGNAGMLSGPTRSTSGFPGAKYANPGSLQFDGDDDFVELGTANLPANDRPQSVSFWFNVTAMPTTDQICVSLTDGMDGGSRLKLGFRANRVSAWKRGGDDLASAPPVAAGWHHYAYTFDGTTHTLYLDGTQANTSTVAPDTGPAASARLGAGHNNAENFAGQIDEVRIYNRPLTPADVTALREGRE